MYYIKSLAIFTFFALLITVIAIRDDTVETNSAILLDASYNTGVQPVNETEIVSDPLTRKRRDMRRSPRRRRNVIEHGEPGDVNWYQDADIHLMRGDPILILH
ncbi:hypothetical protein DdX_19769 [Ditylenchus destructor]|uniref:Uncharacterized protein n=1 Tax=Ditylenchus destructor TaxID=166010 RepID=A0AAD4MJ49_9BILA|nr:hypothetical protein DdX_19769 [Ditylenchus destructor]